jgi:hypothetical protein
MRTIAPTISDIVNYNTMSQRKLFFGFSFVPARDPRSMCQGRRWYQPAMRKQAAPKNAGSRFYVDYANGKDHGGGAALFAFAGCAFYVLNQVRKPTRWWADCYCRS